MKEIYINGRFLTTPISGINRFSFELCRELRRTMEIKIIIPKGSIHKDYDVTGFTIIEFGKLKSHLWEQISLPLFFINKKHYLLLNFSGLGPIIIKNKISTIHDVSFLHNPTWFSKSYYLLYKLLTPLTIKTSRRIFTVSEFSKSEILKYYPFTLSENIDVIYNAVDSLKIYESSNSITKQNLLTVGSLDPRKNLQSLLKAMELLTDNEELHIIGGANRVFAESINLSTQKNNVKFLGRVSESELKQEYSNAKLFILPSLYEGFGIPPLEALHAGCDIAISDIPVFREIFEDAAIYFNAEDPYDISKKISMFLHGDIKIEEKAKKRILKKFSWESSAEKIINILCKN